jgi:2-polyprenyl-3-methyl-5-hydroxy-6-metoxy-1,4-benzoquinol methylase
MEYVNCLLCADNNTQLLVRKNTFNVVRCHRCSLVYVNPRPAQHELAALYNALSDGPSQAISIGQRDPGHELYKTKKFQRAIALIKHHKRDVDKVFDLGCATGVFLDMVAQQGWTPYGSDVNRHLVEQNQSRYGEQIKLQKGTRIDFPERYFDVVTLFDSIEHLPDPVATLREVSRVVRPDGLVVISTPNVEGLLPRWTYQLFGKTLGAWEHPTPPGHVYQFSEKTLNMTLKQADLLYIDGETFEIYRPYTVGQLENAIIHAVMGSPKEPGQSVEQAFPSGHERHNNHPQSLGFMNWLRKLPRLFLRAGCWGFVSCVYPVAGLLQQGDTMVVVAKPQ